SRSPSRRKRTPLSSPDRAPRSLIARPRHSVDGTGQPRRADWGQSGIFLSLASMGRAARSWGRRGVCAGGPPAGALVLACRGGGGAGGLGGRVRRPEADRPAVGLEGSVRRVGRVPERPVRRRGGRLPAGR